MVGLTISSEEIKDILPILGLIDEDQGKVYLSLLSLGMATLGQVSLLSGLDYITTQEALQVLVGSKLAKRIPGKVGRYIALEPYLKAFFLAYDPITLVNIRKESSNAFQVQARQFSDLFAETAATIQMHTSKLEDDFTQGLAPINMNFKKLINDLKWVIESSEDKTQMILEELNDKVQLAIAQLKKLNEDIIEVNILKLKKIPGVFDPYTAKMSQKFSIISQTTKDDIKNYKGEYKINFTSLKDTIHNDFREHSTSVNEVINRFDSDRTEIQETFEEKVKRINSLLETLLSNAVQKKSKFLEIRQSYKEIDDSMGDLFKTLDKTLDNMEPLILHSIDDIQSRKLFKGKETFISNLMGVERDRKAIQQVLRERIVVLEKINGINSTLDETETEIVQATEIGLNELQKVLDEEVKQLSHDLQEIKRKISSEFKMNLHDFLDSKNNIIKMKIDDIQTLLDEKVDIFKQQIDEIAEEFLDRTSNLVHETSEEFIINLKSFLEEKPAFDAERNGFNDIRDKIDKQADDFSIVLKRMIDEISELESAFNLFVNSFNAFTVSFADNQLQSLNSTLKKTEEILNSQTTKIEQQLEQEISALTFSIKEMKQKLNKISELSRSVEFSEVEASFLSSGLVIGETAIIMMLRDLALRAKSSLTILMPRPELQTLKIASKLPMKTRVSIIGDFGKVPESTLKKILSSANLRLKQLDTVDFWGCIRDAEELLVCPEPKHPDKEGLIGVITTNENLVELFSQELMTYTTRSREIVL
ncbi:MAG: hypothetical protein ACFFB2_07240 [Promethearchaeota archaeon]